MNERELTIAELEDMARTMALALDRLECPDCCGPIHEFIEIGARIYHEEHEWAHFVMVVHHYRRQHCAPGARPGEADHRAEE